MEVFSEMIEAKGFRGAGVPPAGFKCSRWDGKTAGGTPAPQKPREPCNQRVFCRELNFCRKSRFQFGTLTTVSDLTISTQRAGRFSWGATRRNGPSAPG